MGAQQKCQKAMTEVLFGIEVLVRNKLVYFQYLKYLAHSVYPHSFNALDHEQLMLYRNSKNRDKVQIRLDPSTFYCEQYGRFLGLTAPTEG